MHVNLRCLAGGLMLMSTTLAIGQPPVLPQATPAPGLGVVLPNLTPTPTPVAPVATPTPTPQPTPTPEPTPTAQPTATAAGAPAIPLTVLDRDRAIQELRRPEVNVDLYQVRVLRVLEFDDPPEVDPLGDELLPPASPLRNLIREGLAMIFRVHVPEHCGILDIRNTRVTEVNTATGEPLRLPSAAGEGLTALSNIVAWQPHDAYVQFTMALPPREHTSLGAFSAEVTVDVGVIAQATAANLRARVGEMLLDRPNGLDLQVQVAAIGENEIQIVAEGEGKRLGRIEFATTGDQPLESYANTVEMATSQGRARQTTTYQFFAVPEQLSLTMDYYPTVETQQLRISYDEVPLP